MYIHLFHSYTRSYTGIHTCVAIFNVNLVDRDTVYIQNVYSIIYINSKMNDCVLTYFLISRVSLWKSLDVDLRDNKKTFLNCYILYMLVV